uniref:Uncharacterized protein n=1 Tax=Arundo donax TaxID=35708 RepID=A0A0A9E5D3_ARUDO
MGFLTPAHHVLGLLREGNALLFPSSRSSAMVPWRSLPRLCRRKLSVKPKPYASSMCDMFTHFVNCMYKMVHVDNIVTSVSYLTTWIR